MIGLFADLLDALIDLNNSYNYSVMFNYTGTVDILDVDIYNGYWNYKKEPFVKLRLTAVDGCVYDMYNEEKFDIDSLSEFIKFLKRSSGIKVKPLFS